MGLGRIICGRIVPFFILLIAIFVGWLSTTPSSSAYLFATLIPLFEGKMPPTLVGHGKMDGTPEVPKDMIPHPRPENEMFLTLPGGFKMPQAGIGTCCRATAYDDVLIERSILWYLLLGGRHIDGAHLYLNHKAVGSGIKEAIKRGVPREEIFFTTKIFPSYYGYNTTMELIPTFLEETGLDYIDLVLMHAPSTFFPVAQTECTKLGLSGKECRKVTWTALSELREKGLMRNIGVSNFSAKHLEELQEINLAPIANNQIQFNPFVPSSQVEIFEYCMKNDISITGYFSLGGAAERSMTKTVDVLQMLATKYGVSISKILLRWSLQKGVAVIPGTGNPKHMKDNLNVYSFEMTEEDMKAVDDLRATKDASKFSFMMKPDSMK